MSDIILRTLKNALENDKSVVIVYIGSKEISQRRIYVRKITEEKVTGYCFKSKGVRIFMLKNILSAQIIE